MKTGGCGGGGGGRGGEQGQVKRKWVEWVNRLCPRMRMRTREHACACGLRASKARHVAMTRDATGRHGRRAVLGASLGLLLGAATGGAT